MVPLDLHASIRSAVELLTHSLDKKVQLTLALQAEECVINGDDTQWQNAFLNLGINAGHAMPNGGSLNFSTRNLILDKIYCDASPFELYPGAYIEIEIRDTGCGIALENLPHIFEPFFTTREPGKGTGLGLSAVYGTVQNHHGAINVYSEVNTGTVFHIYLPVAGGKLPETQGETTADKAEGTIMIVDDEEIVRTTAKFLLEDLGYQTIIANDGVEAIRIYRQRGQEINLVILDMIMPRMNGRETFAQLIALNPQIKILISSGFAKDDDFESFKTGATCDFIRKPYIREELQKAITGLLFPSSK